MSDFEFDPDVIGRVPRRLRRELADLAGAATLSSPDTGASTAATRGAVDRLSALAEGVGTAVTDLADGVARCCELYAAADGDASWLLEAQMAGAVR